MILLDSASITLCGWQSCNSHDFPAERKVVIVACLDVAFVK